MSNNNLLQALTREGVLIAVSVRFWRAAKKLQASDLGLDPDDITNRLISLGHKKLLPSDALAPFALIKSREPELDVVVKNKTPVVERHETTRTLDQFHRMVELVKQVERMIAAEHWLPNEQGFYCGGCPHQEVCKAWHREQVRVSVRMAA